MTEIIHCSRPSNFKPSQYPPLPLPLPLLLLKGFGEAKRSPCFHLLPILLNVPLFQVGSGGQSGGYVNVRVVGRVSNFLWHPPS